MTPYRLARYGCRFLIFLAHNSACMSLAPPGRRPLNFQMGSRCFASVGTGPSRAGPAKTPGYAVLIVLLARLIRLGGGA